MEEVRLLVIGDPHFKPKTLYEAKLLTSNLEKVASKLKPDLIICLGDILDTHELVHTRAYNQACGFLHKMSRISPTFLLIGNHDLINNSQFLTTNHPFNALKKWKNINIVDNVVEFEIKGFYFVLVPYVPPGRFQEALKKCNGDWTKASCIFAHQEFHGCKMGAITSTNGDGWDDTNPLVISGHIHDQHKLKDNIYYTGSCMQHAFGDSITKTIAYLTMRPNKGLENRPKKFRGDVIKHNKLLCYYQKIDLGMPKKKTVYIDIDDIDDFDPEGTEDKIRLVVRGSAEKFKVFKKTKKAKDISSYGVKIAYSQPKSAREIDPHIQKIIGSGKKSYHQILKAIINKEDKLVQDAYKEIFGSEVLEIEQEKRLVFSSDEEESEDEREQSLSEEESEDEREQTPSEDESEQSLSEEEPPPPQKTSKKRRLQLQKIKEDEARNRAIAQAQKMVGKKKQLKGSPPQRRNPTNRKKFHRQEIEEEEARRKAIESAQKMVTKKKNRREDDQAQRPIQRPNMKQRRDRQLRDEELNRQKAMAMAQSMIRR
jgi:hypothetical protein